MSLSDPQTVGEFPRWRKSSYSGGGNDCVEVAGVDGSTAVRDSKNPGGGSLMFDPTRWADFLVVTRGGRFDH